MNVSPCKPAHRCAATSLWRVDSLWGRLWPRCHFLRPHSSPPRAVRRPGARSFLNETLQKGFRRKATFSPQKLKYWFFKSDTIITAVCVTFLNNLSWVLPEAKFFWLLLAVIRGLIFQRILLSLPHIIAGGCCCCKAEKEILWVVKKRKAKTIILLLNFECSDDLTQCFKLCFLSWRKSSAFHFLLP